MFVGSFADTSSNCVTLMEKWIGQVGMQIPCGMEMPLTEIGGGEKGKHIYHFLEIVIDVTVGEKT